MPLALGIDFGTSGCRASVIDAEGHETATARVPIEAPRRNGAAVEQDPECWWQALASCLDDLCPRVAVSEIEALCLDGTSSTLLLCRPDGTPCTAALMYNDARAVDQAARVAAVAPRDSAAHGASASLSKLLWLRSRAEPASPCIALHQADWLLGRLRGRFDHSDENNALKLGYDPVSRRWPDWLGRLGIDPALLPAVVPAGRTLGRIDPALAGRWGFSTAMRIVSGTTDSTASFIATGAGPGDAVTALGSTLVLKVLSETPVFAPDDGVYSHRLGDNWLVGGASNSGGNVLRHFFSQETIDTLTRQLQPERPTGLDYYPLAAPGERFPHNDPDYPPRLEPRPEDDAEFFQGLLEGIAGIEAEGYRRLHELGAPWPKRVLSTGGGAANSAWQAMRSKRLDLAVTMAVHQEAAYGSALLALHSL